MKTLQLKIAKENRNSTKNESKANKQSRSIPNSTKGSDQLQKGTLVKEKARHINKIESIETGSVSVNENLGAHVKNVKIRIGDGNSNVLGVRPYTIEFKYKVSYTYKNRQNKSKKNYLDNIYTEAIYQSFPPPIESDDTYCICKGRDDGRPMIECEACLQWFHVGCVGLYGCNPNSKLSYKCDSCIDEKRNETTKKERHKRKQKR